MAETLERLQVLVTSAQRRRLDAAARSSGAAVTALIRDAIDQAYPDPVDWDRRRRAAQSLLAHRRDSDVSFESMEQDLDVRFDPPTEP